MKSLERFRKWESVSKALKDYDGIWIELKDGYRFKDDKTTARSWDKVSDIDIKQNQIEKY